MMDGTNILIYIAASLVSVGHLVMFYFVFRRSMQVLNDLVGTRDPP